MTGDDRAYPGWVPVVCPWQPSSLDPRGYPGWLREAHLIGDDTGGHDDAPEDESWAVPWARWSGRPGPGPRAPGAPLPLGRHLPLGLDCSGLVHLVHRELGRVLPRDAHDQQAATEPVDPADALPGDLYFFARPGERCTVGIVTGPYRMIHASERRAVVEEPLDDRRRPR